MKYENLPKKTKSELRYEYLLLENELKYYSQWLQNELDKLDMIKRKKQIIYLTSKKFLE